MTYDEYIAKSGNPFWIPERNWWTPCEDCGVMPGDWHKCKLHGYHKFWSSVVDEHNGKPVRRTGRKAIAS